MFCIPTVSAGATLGCCHAVLSVTLGLPAGSSLALVQETDEHGFKPGYLFKQFLRSLGNLGACVCAGWN